VLLTKSKKNYLIYASRRAKGNTLRRIHLRKRYLFLVAAVVLSAVALVVAGNPGPSLGREISAKTAPRTELAITGNGMANNVGVVQNNKSDTLGSVSIASSEDAWLITIEGGQQTDVACRENGDLVVSMTVVIPKTDYSAGVLAGEIR
jgi:hypothetical protein